MSTGSIILESAAPILQVRMAENLIAPFTVAPLPPSPPAEKASTSEDYGREIQRRRQPPISKVIAYCAFLAADKWGAVGGVPTARRAP
jgi:hypothetical protein